MLYEFQVLYMRRLPDPSRPIGQSEELLSILVRAETENEAAAIVQSDGLVVHRVGPGHPLIDWNQAVFNREEAAVYLRHSTSLIDGLMGAGDLPKAKNGRPLFRKAWLDEHIDKRMGQKTAA